MSWRQQLVVMAIVAVAILGLEFSLFRPNSRPATTRGAAAGDARATPAPTVAPTPSTAEATSQARAGGTTPPPTPASAISPAPPPSNVVLAASQPTTPKSDPSCTYFSVTHHNLCASFHSYWDTFGGLAVYGYPLTEEYTDPSTGLVTQYFERARFEAHPGEAPQRFNVLLGPLGDELTTGRQSEAPFQKTTAKADPSCIYFAATGHNLCADFRAYWDKFGGLAVYGMPISEEFVEKNPDTGKLYTVQYFERQRFEWHPGEAPQRYDVLLGRVGAQILAAKYGANVTP